MYNLEREDFADIINHHWSTVKSWETEDIPPKPNSIKDICNKFNLSLKYFHEYYNIYYDNNYTEKIQDWKNKNNYTYSDITMLLNITHSNFGRLLNGKINLSYNVYLKLKEFEVI